jgi:hypothetical protein
MSIKSFRDHARAVTGAPRRQVRDDRDDRSDPAAARPAAEAQIDDLSDAEIDVLLEIYEVLRLTPDNGRKLRPTGNMYVLLDPQRTSDIVIDHRR